MGTQSSAMRRKFIPSVAWNRSVGRKTYRNTPEVIGRPRMASATGFSASVSSVARNHEAPTPIRMPSPARITEKGSLSRAATGSASPVSRKSAARMATGITISMIAPIAEAQPQGNPEGGPAGTLGPPLPGLPDRRTYLINKG